MESRSQSADLFYQTQPPKQILNQKVDTIFEYVIFAGTFVYVTDQVPVGIPPKKTVVGSLTEVSQDALSIEVDDVSIFSEKEPLQVSFGYKRKRAEFQCVVLSISEGILQVSKPQQLSLTNLRKSPRVRVQYGSQRIEGVLSASTSLGRVQIDNLELNEVSQLGMSLFLDRKQGLILPGDAVDEILVKIGGHQVFKGKGTVIRVNMKRHSKQIEGSYEAVIRFEKYARFALGEVHRSAKRVPILESMPVYFQAEHPFFPGRALRGHVIEISSSGLSCLLERSGFPIVPGMRFLKCNLQLPHRPSREFVFEVVHVSHRSDGEVSEFKIGGEFVKSNVELLKDISSYSQEVSGGIIQDVTEEDLDLFWEFLFETNFIYQSKRQQLQGNSKKILETYHRLISQDNGIVKKVVYKEGEEIKGHLSAIRFYDHAWIFQHLNALKAKGGSAAQSVLEAMVGFFYDIKANFRTDTFYVMTYFRPNNLYPAVLFGESCRRMADPANSCMIDFHFGVFNEESHISSGDVAVSVDVEGDYLAFADILIEREMVPFMRALGLGTRTKNHLEVAAEYRRLGLKRSRHLLSVQSGNDKVYALVECSSAGLNLSELTNSVMLFSSGRNAETLRALGGTLVSYAYENYFSNEGVFPVVLQTESENRPDNVSWSKIYTCWTNSTVGFPAFERQSRAVLAEFPGLVESYKKRLFMAEGSGAESEAVK